MEQKPIFIGGLSFTGKTQLRLMLSAHPNIQISRHTRMWDFFYKRYGDLNKHDNLERCLQGLVTSKHIHSLNPNVDRIRAEVLQGLRTYERLFAIIHAQHAEEIGKPRWGDQLGFIERHADAIFAAYPSARMIHMVRDPGARFSESALSASRRAGHVGWETAWWLRSASLASLHMKKYPGRYLVARYESLFGRPEQSMRDICDFLEESFYPEMLLYGKIAAHAPSARPQLAKHHLRFIQSHARDWMDGFGYSDANLRLSAKEWFLYSIDWPVNLAGLLAGMFGAGFGQHNLFQRELP